MADNLSKPFAKSALTEEEMRENKQEQKKQIIAFSLMIFLTLIAFGAVASDVVSRTFAIPFILILGFTQFLLQLLFFMHMKDKDHGWSNSFMVSGMVIATPMIAALILLLGITKY